MIAFYNGSYTQDDANSILPGDFDALYGCFTTLKFANGKLYFLKEHLERLKNTADYLKIDFLNYNFDFVIKQLMDLNNKRSAKVKIHLFKGEQTNCLITISDLVLIKNPINTKSLVVQRDILDDIYKYKTLHNSENMLFHQKAIDDNLGDYIYINSKGYILEATFSNIYFVYDNKIFTPPLFMPILPGIIRKFLLDSDLPYDFTLVEKMIHYSEIKNYDEIFITNSIKGIVPIKQVDNFSFQIKSVQILKSRIDI